MGSGLTEEGYEVARVVLDLLDVGADVGGDAREVPEVGGWGWDLGGFGVG